MNPITLRRELACRAAPRALWAILSDVEALSRGLSQIALPNRPVEGGNPELAGAVEFYSERAGQRYFELPAEFTSGTELRLRRQYPTGPLAALTTRFTITPVGQTSRLEIALSLEPRRSAWRFILRLYGELSLRHLASTFKRFDDALLRGENPTRVITPFDETTLTLATASIKSELSDDDQPALEKLITHLRGLDDLGGQRLQPFALADAWELPKERLLSVCLAAAAHGLLALRWDAICANCRLPARRFENLAEIGEKVPCARCGVAIAIDLEANLEASFDIGRAMKSAAVYDIARRAIAYAASNPSRAPHIIVEERLPAAGRLKLQVPNEPGEYRIFLHGGATGRLNVSTLGPPSAQLLAERELSPSAIEVAMGGTLEIAHEHTQPRQLQLLRTDWQNQGAAAHTVTLQPHFRRYFPSQKLPPGLLLPVAQVALWQSELTGTIELCKLIGEKATHDLLHEHLELLTGIVAREGGALLRALPDGILVAFGDAVQAARVALLAQKAFFTLVEADAKAQAALGLRIGLFSGPCHLCSLAGDLSYFGTTQLVSLRLLREAHSGDIVLAAELCDRLEAAKSQVAADAPPWKIGPRFAISVRGLDAPLLVVRMRLA